MVGCVPRNNILSAKFDITMSMLKKKKKSLSLASTRQQIKYYFNMMNVKINFWTAWVMKTTNF